MKKLISMLLVLTMIGGVMVSCGNSEEKSGIDDQKSTAGAVTSSADQTEDKGEVNVYLHLTQLILGDEKQDADGNTYRDESTAWLKFAAEDFTKETGIKVNFVPFNDFNGEIKPLLQVGDKGIDLATNVVTLTREEKELYLAPLLSVEEAKNIYDDKFVDAMSKNDAGDEILMWQIAKSYSNGIAYNEDVIKAAGYDEIPDTLAEFTTMCEKIRDNGQVPIVLHRVENWPLSTVSDFSDYIPGKYNAIADILNSDDPFGDSTSLGQMIKIYTNFKANGFFEKNVYTDFGVAMDAVSQGKAGMMLFGSWLIPQLKSRVPEGTDPSIIKFDAAVDYGSGRHITLTNEWDWGLNKQSPNKENAKKFLDYISKRADVIAKTGFIDARTDVTPIVPELYSMIDQKIADGTVTPIYTTQKSDDYYKVEEILSDADLWADYKYVGLLFDSYDTENPSWDNYKKEVKTQNKYFLNSKKSLGY
ncbi:MAG: ABC transporter substrate-binding protein [Sphaerochaeta sp.]